MKIYAINQEEEEELRCCCCTAELSSWYFEKDGKRYCKHDFWATFGDACNGCFAPITGPIMVAGDHRFHPECFKCSKCDAFIGDGETYALVERTKLFCGECYEARRRMSLLAAPVPGNARPHTIHLVEIPVTPSGIHINSHSQPRRHTHYVQISRLDTSSNLSGLVQVGDRILEVNGTPVKEKSIKEIDDLLASPAPTQKLLLTVERDPVGLVPATRPASSLLDATLRIPSKPHYERSTSLPRDNASFSRSPSRSPTPSKRLSRSDISRTQSFRSAPSHHRVFRTNDLIIGETLGSGFFGRALKVTHRSTGEVMVLKELVRFDLETQNSFMKELTVLRSLEHPNVLRFLGVLIRDKKLNLITEYISGGTLKSRLHDTEEWLSWLQRVKYARDIAAGMAYLHSVNVIHRDLNSQNCFIKQDETVVVADFGLARIMVDSMEKKDEEDYKKQKVKFSPSDERKAHRKEKRRKRYTVVGNPYWMAPEMMKGETYDERVDIFSFGIVLCEIIGRVEADPDYLPRTMDFGLNKDVFYRKFCGECPPPFVKATIMCTQLDPDLRPSFEELHEWLRDLELHLDLGTPAPAPLLGDPLLLTPPLATDTNATTAAKSMIPTASKSLSAICENGGRNKSDMMT